MRHGDIATGFDVAPHAGAWIETHINRLLRREVDVAPHAGAWIETEKWGIKMKGKTRSHPTRVRGLKRESAEWCDIDPACRTPRGCVD